MVSNTFAVVWTNQAQLQMRKAYEYICEDSPKNAFKVLESIIAAVNKASAYPEIYPPDKYRLNNDGTYRAFTKHHFRVSYRAEKNIIRVLRVRHTSRKPDVY